MAKTDTRVPLVQRTRDLAESLFPVQILGIARAVSQFGVAYTTYANGYLKEEGQPFVRVDYDDKIMEIVETLFRDELAKGHDVIVWRWMPEEVEIDGKRRLMFRAHFMPHSMIALAWEQPGLSERVFQRIVEPTHVA